MKLTSIAVGRVIITGDSEGLSIHTARAAPRPAVVSRQCTHSKDNLVLLKRKVGV